ncbi:hypothetical protein BC940DRAFT_313391 [Gongronella butleri]|nr:hypothetical protein BC940DRAFT_313391 [Gongronella butleri]
MADRDIPFGGLSAGNDRSKAQADVDIFGGKVGQPIDPCYQKSCDTLDNVNGDILVRQARAYAAITERFAKSVQDIRAKQQN